MTDRIQKIRKAIRVMAFLVLFTLLPAGTGITAHAATATYKVQFGTGKADTYVETYPQYAKKVKEGTTIQLPKKNTKTEIGYWLNIKSKKLYVGGSDYKVTWNTKFTLRLVPKKTITFCSPSTGNAFTQLTKVYAMSTHVTMPDFMKEHSAYSRFLGWSRSRYAKVPSYLPGEKVRIYGNTRFYAVIGSKDQKQTAYIYLRYNDGTLYKKLEAADGLTFPSVNPNNTTTMIGWSTVKGKKAGPEYLEEETIPNRAGTYYMVIRKSTDDPISGVSDLTKVTRHSYLYIVGDSRTAYMKDTFGNNPWKVKLIGMPGGGLNWLKGLDTKHPSNGYKILLSNLEAQKDTTYGRHPAVVFNLGVNDLGNATAYVEYYKKIAATLKKTYNCELYVMSVNPINRQMISDTAIRFGSAQEGTLSARTVQKVQTFNTILKKGLAGTYEYIDCNQYLLTSGWTSWANSGVNSYKYADGLHYTKSTYEKIYNYILSVTEKM